MTSENLTLAEPVVVVGTSEAEYIADRLRLRAVLTPVAALVKAARDWRRDPGALDGLLTALDDIEESRAVIEWLASYPQRPKSQDRWCPRCEKEGRYVKSGTSPGDYCLRCGLSAEDEP